MPLIELNTQPESPDDRDREFIRVEVNRIYRMLLGSRSVLADRVWKQNGRTPQQVFDSLGTDAVQFLLASRKLDELGTILGYPPPDIVPADVHLEIDENGRVLVVRNP
jgi:hypothetical protein